MRNIIGLIPAAGKGSRLGLPFSKEMFPDIQALTYKPVIMSTVEAMKVAGIKHVIFTINPCKTDILSYLGNGHQFGMRFTYCIHPNARSLPESLNEAYHLIQNATVVFAMPDTVIRPVDHLKTLLQDHLSRTTDDVTLGCFRASNPAKFGMVDFESDRVTEIVDKPDKTGLEWMWGTMVWNERFTKVLNEYVVASVDSMREELILTDALRDLIGLRKVGLCKFCDGDYKDIGTFDEIVNWSQSLVPSKRGSLSLSVTSNRT